VATVDLVMAASTMHVDTYTITPRSAHRRAVFF